MRHFLWNGDKRKSLICFCSIQISESAFLVFCLFVLNFVVSESFGSKSIWKVVNGHWYSEETPPLSSTKARSDETSFYLRWVCVGGINGSVCVFIGYPYCELSLFMKTLIWHLWLRRFFNIFDVVTENNLGKFLQGNSQLYLAFSWFTPLTVAYLLTYYSSTSDYYP